MMAKTADGAKFIIEVPDTELVVGSSLGNDKCWATSKGTGATQSIFSIDLGVDVFGSMNVCYCSSDHQIIHQGCADETVTALGLCQLDSYIQLPQIGSGIFQLHPAYQNHQFELPSKIKISETFFLPCTAKIDPVVVYQIIELENFSEDIQRLRIYGYVNLRGNTPCDIQARYDPVQKAIVAWNNCQPSWTRLFGCTRGPDGYEVTHDVSQVYDPINVLPLSNRTDEESDVLGVLQIDLDLKPHTSERFAFIMAFSQDGEQSAKKIYQQALDYQKAFEDTLAYYQKILSVSEVITPNPIINQGVLWSKANMVRVMATFPTGAGFTNEPGVSSNIVARDVAWYTYGCDFLLPEFSRELLLNLARLQEEGGKIVEYYDGRTGQSNDYGLNINDNTPLFILAAAHYCQCTADAIFLEKMYPAVEGAAHYIVSQKDDRGLIFCTATGEEVRGIASWRNIIPRYSINGAVTEINAECYAALRGVSLLAQALGRDKQTVDYFASEAEKLKQAINQHLLNPRNGMYYLNIDIDGNTHTDVTGDQVFPIIFGVSPDSVSFRIVSRLNSPDFWTKAGMRTVSRESPDYTPDKNVGLQGGVWPGLSFWYAFSAAEYHPELMMEALSRSFEHYIRDPKAHNTVPGQFSEWFDGESLVNRGMRLSPWEPPRYLWAAIEGACGVKRAQMVFRSTLVFPGTANG